RRCGRREVRAADSVPDCLGQQAVRRCRSHAASRAGKLDLAEPVVRWLPGCPPQWQRVSVHHLLTHTAGVRHWGDTSGFDASQRMDIAERVALIQQAPLLSDPGARWHYSSPGYLLVGQVVEQASGQPYAGFLAREVLVPLRLTSTCVGCTP